MGEAQLFSDLYSESFKLKILKSLSVIPYEPIADVYWTTQSHQFIRVIYENIHYYYIIIIVV